MSVLLKPNLSAHTTKHTAGLPLPAAWCCPEGRHQHHNTSFHPLASVLTSSFLETEQPELPQVSTLAEPLVGGGGGAAYGQPKNWSAMRPASRSPLRKAP